MLQSIKFQQQFPLTKPNKTTKKHYILKRIIYNCSKEIFFLQAFFTSACPLMLFYLSCKIKHANRTNS